MCLGRWLKPHVLVMMVCSGASTVGGDPFGNQRAGFFNHLPRHIAIHKGCGQSPWAGG